MLGGGAIVDAAALVGGALRTQLAIVWACRVAVSLGSATLVVGTYITHHGAGLR